jgi:hypothetical protein
VCATPITEMANKTAIRIPLKFAAMPVTLLTIDGPPRKSVNTALSTGPGLKFSNNFLTGL